MPPHAGTSHKTDVYLYERCQCAPEGGFNAPRQGDDFGAPHMGATSPCPFGSRPRPEGPASDWTTRRMSRMRRMIPSEGRVWLQAIHLMIEHWWVEEDLNLRPHAYQACALTT